MPYKVYTFLNSFFTCLTLNITKAQGQAKSIYTDIWLAKARLRPTDDVSVSTFIGFLCCADQERVLCTSICYCFYVSLKYIVCLLREPVLIQMEYKI